MVRVLGETGKSLASRIAYGILLGPVFAWYLLARGVIPLVFLQNLHNSFNFISVIGNKNISKEMK